MVCFLMVLISVLYARNSDCSLNSTLTVNLVFAMLQAVFRSFSLVGISKSLEKEVFDFLIS